MRYRFFLSFLGSSYFGMQRQKGKATVQQKVEETLSSLTGEEVEIKYSGRTDAGVSAAAMPAAFSCSRELDCPRMESLLNRRLPKDIAVHGLERCDDSFKPRQDSVGKRYSYTFSLKRKFPLRCHSCAYLGDYDLDLDAFKRALDCFKGTHDFSNFTSKEEDVGGFVRHIYSIEVNDDDGAYRVDIVGDGFMTYQIRLMMGYAIRVGIGRATLDELKEALERKPRLVTHYKAPAEGLCLEEVYYDEDELLLPHPHP